MSFIAPFRALRPAPAVAARVASVPYDVVSADEARALAAGEPLSFLHVTRSEIDLPAGTSPYATEVYARAVANLRQLQEAAPLLQDREASLYVYRLQMGAHVQTGVAGVFSVDEYEHDLIKKHEKTRKDKEDDRTRHIVETAAQTGIVFLTFRQTSAIDAALARAAAGAPIYDFTAPDGVVHQVWQVAGAAADPLVRAFRDVPALYIADGHHRAASAARARQEFARIGRPTTAAARFLAVAFSDAAVQILPYNRTVKDLAGQTPEALLAALDRSGMTAKPGGATPQGPGEASMFLDGRWYQFRLPPADAGSPRDESLDVEVLQRRVLGPILQVGDPRTDKRIDFVGGIRGTAELEQRVNSGQAAVAFSLHAVGINDLMAIADAGGIMPPKSTWFEP
ncbi:MAG TPA: DUF1015 family protein, partial [Vicinamibacterales bacterium]|nr:DUF1015 family protein [Vicinamibacterales bacterium]